MAEAKLAVIGGSGLYLMEGLTNCEDVRVDTPFGPPSDAITLGDLAGMRVAFLPRHGKGHRISPTELPSQANIYALKSLGVEWIIAISAAGSLREEIRPLDAIVPDQVIDRTKSRVNTFFGGGLVAHVGFADPFCPILRHILCQSAAKVGASVHTKGTYLVMEGPLFSTRAESNLYRTWGADIIGMTALPEAKLAREAEICYATLAFVTDYDCWREATEIVTIEMIIDNLQRNVDLSKKILRETIAQIPKRRTCQCPTALENAIVTQKQVIPIELKEKLHLLIGKYMQ